MLNKSLFLVVVCTSGLFGQWISPSGGAQNFTTVSATAITATSLTITSSGTTPTIQQGSTQSYIQFNFPAGNNPKAYVGACPNGPCFLDSAGNIALVHNNSTHVLSGSGPFNGTLYQTSTNCSSSAAPAVCAAAPAGSVVVAAAATTVTVNTTAVTANSQILLTVDSSLGTKLSVTCNTTYQTPMVTARTAGTSFVITVGGAPVTNPLCLSYSIVN